MVNKCAAFGCKSGYKGHEQTGVKITFHSFPLNNKDLCDKWIRANPRKDFVPSKHSKLCSLHFQPTDFIDKCMDTNSARRQHKSVAHGDKLSLPYLKEYAVPSIFQNAPKYLSTNFNEPRETVSATASSRFEREINCLSVMEQLFFAADDISGLSVD